MWLHFHWAGFGNKLHPETLIVTAKGVSIKKKILWKIEPTKYYKSILWHRHELSATVIAPQTVSIILIKHGEDFCLCFYFFVCFLFVQSQGGQIILSSQSSTLPEPRNKLNTAAVTFRTKGKPLYVCITVMVGGKAGIVTSVAPNDTKIYTLHIHNIHIVIYLLVITNYLWKKICEQIWCNF